MAYRRHHKRKSSQATSSVGAELFAALIVTVGYALYQLIKLLIHQNKR